MLQIIFNIDIFLIFFLVKCDYQYTNLIFHYVTSLFLTILKPCWQATSRAKFLPYTVSYALSFFFKIYQAIPAASQMVSDSCSIFKSHILEKHLASLLSLKITEKCDPTEKLSYNKAHNRTRKKRNLKSIKKILNQTNNYKYKRITN